MAEVIGVVSGVVSLVVVAGQLAKRAYSLYNFINAIQDMPLEAKHLADELRLFHIILTEVKASFSGDEQVLQPALDLCQTTVRGLEQLLEQSYVKPGFKKNAIRWRQVRDVLKRPELDRHTAMLERAKSMLLQSSNIAHRNISRGHTIQLQAISRELSGLSSKHDALNGTAENAAENTSQVVRQSSDILQEVSHISGTVIETELKIRQLMAQSSLTQTGIEDITKRLDAPNNVTNQTSQANNQIEQHSSQLSQSIAGVSETTMKTNSQINHLTEDFIHVRTSVDDLAKKITEETLGNRTILLQHLNGAVEFAISKAVKEHLSDLHHRPAQESETATFSASSVSRLHSRSTSHLRQPDDGWIQDSATCIQEGSVYNLIFGKLAVRSSKFTYRRRLGVDHCERKEESHIRVWFIPASWIVSKGAILTVRSLKMLQTSMKPHNTYGLSTFNIRPTDSDIFYACDELDICRVQALFDQGLASPYDIDSYGNSLLDYAAFGLQCDRSTITIAELRSYLRLSEIIANYGVDAGQFCLHEYFYCPAITFVGCFLLLRCPTGDSLFDEYFYALSKVLEWAVTDPFDAPENILSIFILVDFNGNACIEFPGACLSDAASHVDTAWWDTLMAQQLFPVYWDYNTIRLAARLQNQGGLSTLETVQDLMIFWVTCQATRVSRYLATKADILSRALRSSTHKQAQWSYCCHETVLDTIEEGGLMLEILTRRTYGVRGELPWVRQRTRKLEALEHFLVFVLTELLSFIGQPDQELLAKYSRVTSESNARIFCIWRKALEQFTQTTGTVGLDNVGLKKSCNANNTDPITSTFRHGSEKDEEEEWLSEEASDSGSESGWETEEDWEAGYMLEKAVDRYPQDERDRKLGQQIPGVAGHPGDYDHVYWSQFYDEWLYFRCRAAADSGHQENLGRLKSIAKTARDVVSFIV